MENQYRQIVRQKIVDSLAVPIPELTRRDVWLPSVPNKAIAVIGMRRAGKTCLLWKIIAERLAQGTPREGLLYFSFEDERLAGLRAKDLDLLVEEYYRLYPEWRDQRRATFFLDEIQIVPGWESFARRLLDSEKVDLFLSGSSARMLSREVATSMRGRAMEAVVLQMLAMPWRPPFSWNSPGAVPKLPTYAPPMALRSIFTHALSATGKN